MPSAICRAGETANDAAAKMFEQAGLQWLKFGQEHFCHAPDVSDAVWNRLRGAGIAVSRQPERPGEAGPHGQDGLFLVTQEGRLFQRAHPDVPVLYDRGRHLVVSLDRRRATAMARQPARFSIRPVTGNETVFTLEPRPAVAPAADPRISSLVGRASRASFVMTVAELASYPTRHSLSTHFQQAAHRLCDRLQLMGYDTQLQHVPLSEGSTLNVIADKKGSGRGERSLTLVTAHLDSVNHPTDPTQPDDPTAPAPGADDNASGSAGVIEIARVLKDEHSKHDLRLILFGGEEQGLFGSRHYVEQLHPDEQARIAGVVNMDMIAVLNAAPPAVLLEGGPISLKMIEGLRAAAHAYTRLTVNTSLDPHDSDHVSFIDAGIPAVLTIEGSDDKNSRYIHSAHDTLDRLDHDLALEILRMNIAFTAEHIGV